MKALVRCLSYHLFTWPVFAHVAIRRPLIHKEWFFCQCKASCDISVQYLILQLHTHDSLYSARFYLIAKNLRGTEVLKFKKSVLVSFFLLSVFVCNVRLLVFHCQILDSILLTTQSLDTQSEIFLADCMAHELSPFVQMFSRSARWNCRRRRCYGMNALELLAYLQGIWIRETPCIHSIHDLCWLSGRVLGFCNMFSAFISLLEITFWWPRCGDFKRYMGYPHTVQSFAVIIILMEVLYLTTSLLCVLLFVWVGDGGRGPID